MTLYPYESVIYSKKVQIIPIFPSFFNNYNLLSQLIYKRWKAKGKGGIITIIKTTGEEKNTEIIGVDRGVEVLLIAIDRENRPMILATEEITTIEEKRKKKINQIIRM